MLDRCSGNEEAGRNKCCVLLLIFSVARVSLPPPTKLRTKALRKFLAPRAPYEAIATLPAKRVDWKAKDWTAKDSRINDSGADGGMVQANERKNGRCEVRGVRVGGR